ncbi:Uncharacterized protein Rs2_35077 [Raphanus sativus]|nr:Uncharacterized protein Rs2_35077 [Raphanus sativus]
MVPGLDFGHDHHYHHHDDDEGGNHAFISGRNSDPILASSASLYDNNIWLKSLRSQTIYIYSDPTAFSRRKVISWAREAEQKRIVRLKQAKTYIVQLKASESKRRLIGGLFVCAGCRV